MFRGFLNTSTLEILKSKNLRSESLIKLQKKKCYFEILALKYLKNPGTQTPLFYLCQAICGGIPFKK